MNLTAIYKIDSRKKVPMLKDSLQRWPGNVETVVVAGFKPLGEWPADRIIEGYNTSLTEARNIGVEHATHDKIVFVDDDAYPSEGYVNRIPKGFEHADMVGGPLYPDYQNGEISWLPKGWQWLIGCGPYYEQKRMVPNTYGSNLAITKEAFNAVDGFDESIGMGSNGVGQGAETDLCRRVREAGYTGVWYDPNAVMYHRIRDRNSIRALHKRAYQQGEAKAQLGLDDREGQFLREELLAMGDRNLKRMLSAVTLTASVGLGYLREKY